MTAPDHKDNKAQAHGQSSPWDHMAWVVAGEGQRERWRQMCSSLQHGVLALWKVLEFFHRRLLQLWLSRALIKP